MTSNLDGLDLEVSGEATSAARKQAIIAQGSLVDSLDLNTGVDTLLKLQEAWSKKKKPLVMQNPEKEQRNKSVNAQIKGEPEDEDSM